MVERSIMKQICVTGAMLFTLGLPLQFTSVELDQTAVNRRIASAELDVFSAQSRQENARPRIRVQPRQPPASEFPPYEYGSPGPGAVRQCVDWYATEYRPSGTVVTPQIRCRWVRRQ
jgi:hypothetical protein